MESNFFRRLAAELGPALDGARVEKVFRPAAHVWTLRLDLPGERKHLLLAQDRRSPCCFLSADKPDNPELPDASAMWLRKRAAGRRLRSWSADWPGRRLAWALSGAEAGDEAAFLVLDLRRGLLLEKALDPAFGVEPSWPELTRVLDEGDLWRDFAQITPPLRRLLQQAAAKSTDRALALYQAVQRGQGGECYVYLSPNGPGQALVWRREVDAAKGEREVVVESALEAAALSGRDLVFGAVRSQAAAPETGAAKARRRQLANGLAKVAAEEERMLRLCAGRDKALAVQASLARVRSDERLAQVTGMGPDGSDMVVDLDARLTVAENMQRLFKLAAKGERGLKHAAARRAELEAELEALDQGRWSAPVAEERASRRSVRTKAAGDKDFARFTSSDGFALLRGKNARANSKLVREVAAPFDLWFHAQDGPGSHVLLKRDHAGQEVPERSLLEAAALAALKSWQSGESRGRVMCAEARHVKPVKGGPAGTVRVDRMLASLTPDLDPDLEARLAVKPSAGRGSRPLDAGPKKR